MMCAPKTEQIISQLLFAFTSLCVYVVRLIFIQISIDAVNQIISRFMKKKTRKKQQQVQILNEELLGSNVTCFDSR